MPVRLIGEDDFEIIGTPWWTKDGHPITYDEDRNKDNRGGTENRPPKEGETRDDMEQDEKDDDIFQAGYAKTPVEMLESLSPKSNAEVLLPGLENGDITLDLSDLAVLEILSLQPILEKMQQSPVFRAELGYQFDKWQITRDTIIRVIVRNTVLCWLLTPEQDQPVN